MNPLSALKPGSTLGIMGGGQLARMLCMEARRMGYRTLVWTGGLEAPAAEVCDEVCTEPFADLAAAAAFAARCAVATVEFENLPLSSLEAVSQHIPLHPSPTAIATCAHRAREKHFLRENAIPCAPFWLVKSAAELARALEELAGAGVLKTAEWGYDGKGQRRVATGDDAALLWRELDTPAAVLEAYIDFSCEISVMIARGQDGQWASYDPCENRHRDHILDLTIAPATLPPSLLESARAIAVRIAEALDYVGIMGVEFFVTRSGSLLVNEMAPRPHNSGHHTLDACFTSQFEQQLRATVGLPLGDTRLLTPATMLNLLGDMWPCQGDPAWDNLLRDPAVALHLYGKKNATQRRKMGHATFLGHDSLTRATAAKQQLLGAASL
jgi:5-(carboxyamino)imidazole ribonucleotide synthase